jgi:hypothetical protein
MKKEKSLSFILIWTRTIYEEALPYAAWRAEEIEVPLLPPCA